jgi:nickel-dependent lactate racemase
MKIDIPYGADVSTLMAPSGVGVEHVSPRAGDPVEDTASALEAACREPVDSSPLAGRVGAGKKVLVVISDLTRSPATRELLPLVVDGLLEHGVAREDVRVLVARGTHRSLSKDEKAFLRAGTLKGLAVAEHDCDDGARLCALVLTRHGTPVRVNRWVREADLVVLLSPISFHYFAGFGGGRKLLLPGCADRASILANHRLSLCDTHPVKLHPSCRPGNIDGNPVHDDMVEATRALGHLFAVNFFTDVEGRLVFVNAGDPVASHEAACERYAECYAVAVPGRASVVVAGTGGWPHDINLLQAHKSLYHATGAAAAGGSILLFARCEEGVGSQSLSEAMSAARDVFFDRAYEDYALNNQTGVSLLGLTERFRVAMVTELEDEVLASAGISRCANPEAWVAEALERQKADRMIVIRHAGQTLPRALKE